MGPDHRFDDAAEEQPSGRGQPHRQPETEPTQRRFHDEAEEELYYVGLIEDGTHPQRVVARMRLAQIYERRGWLEDAAELCQRNLWVGAHDSQVFRQLASIYRRLGREDLADVVSEQIARQSPAITAPRRQQARPLHPSMPQSLVGAVRESWLRLGVFPQLARSPGLGAALGWLALAVLFAAGAAFIFALVSPVLGSPGLRSSSPESQRPQQASAPPQLQPQVTTMSSTAAPSVAQAPPVQAPPIEMFGSSGLGVTRDEWERAHGRPERGDLFVEYEAGRFTVGFLDGNVWYMERIWGNRDAVALEGARGTSRELMPVDSRLVRTINPSGDQVLDVHASESLIARFKATAWNGGSPGSLTVRYRVRASDGYVTAMQLRLGDSGQ